MASSKETKTEAVRCHANKLRYHTGVPEIVLFDEYRQITAAFSAFLYQINLDHVFSLEKYM